jgi:hypothetical protein
MEAAMPTTINLTAEVPANHQLTITLPDEIPTGPADITLVVKSQTPPGLVTLGELAESEFFGLWRDREDIVNSADFARDLRKEAWSRQA